MRTTILYAVCLHSRSVRQAARPAVTASGPSPPPEATWSALVAVHDEGSGTACFFELAIGQEGRGVLVVDMRCGVSVIS